jgi:hypothetical protein
VSIHLTAADGLSVHPLLCRSQSISQRRRRMLLSLQGMESIPTSMKGATRRRKKGKGKRKRTRWWRRSRYWLC